MYYLADHEQLKAPAAHAVQFQGETYYNQHYREITLRCCANKLLIMVVLSEFPEIAI